MVYTSYFYPTLNSYMYTSRLTCVKHIVWHHPSRIFYVLPRNLWLSWSLCHLMWLIYDWVMLSLTLTLSSKDRKMKNKLKWKWKWETTKSTLLCSWQTWSILEESRCVQISLLLSRMDSRYCWLVCNKELK